MRRLLPFAAALALLLAACGGDDESGEVSSGGDWPHDLVADTVDGGSIDLAAMAGDDLMLWFWAPW